VWVKMQGGKVRSKEHLGVKRQGGKVRSNVHVGVKRQGGMLRSKGAYMWEETKW